MSQVPSNAQDASLPGLRPRWSSAWASPSGHWCGRRAARRTAPGAERVASASLERAGGDRRERRVEPERRPGVPSRRSPGRTRSLTRDPGRPRSTASRSRPPPRRRTAATRRRPRRLAREEKPLFDQGQRLRAAVETNREEGVARKEEIEVAPSAPGGSRWPRRSRRTGRSSGWWPCETSPLPPAPGTRHGCSPSWCCSRPWRPSGGRRSRSGERRGALAVIAWPCWSSRCLPSGGSANAMVAADVPGDRERRRSRGRRRRRREPATVVPEASLGDARSLHRRGLGRRTSSAGRAASSRPTAASTRPARAGRDRGSDCSELDERCWAPSGAGARRAALRGLRLGVAGSAPRSASTATPTRTSRRRMFGHAAAGVLPVPLRHRALVHRLDALQHASPVLRSSGSGCRTTSTSSATSTSPRTAPKAGSSTTRTSTGRCASRSSGPSPTSPSASGWGLILALMLNTKGLAVQADLPGAADPALGDAELHHGADLEGDVPPAVRRRQPGDPDVRRRARLVVREAVHARS